MRCITLMRYIITCSVYLEGLAIRTTFSHFIEYVLKFPCLTTPGPQGDYSQQNALFLSMSMNHQSICLASLSIIPFNNLGERKSQPVLMLIIVYLVAEKGWTPLLIYQPVRISQLWQKLRRYYVPLTINLPNKACPSILSSPCQASTPGLETHQAITAYETMVQ